MSRSKDLPINVKAELEKLLKVLVDETTKEDASFSQKLDTFKELRAYYALTLKSQGKNTDDDEDSDEFSFDNGIGDQHGATRSVRGRGNS